MKPSIKDQFELAQDTSSFEEGVSLMNTLVISCKPKPKLFGIFKRATHRFNEDYTHCLNTCTYTMLFRCSDCGYMILGSGL